jgi:hypothetical protein
MMCPAAVAWRHRGARDGFEVVIVRGADDGYRFNGDVAAVEGGIAWAVRYSLLVDRSWKTQSAQVSSLSPSGAWERRIEADGRGGWHVDGESAPDLAGCLDVDLEASAFTNALPVCRLRLAIGDAADAPAVYVNAVEPRIERLEQRYERLPDDGAHARYDYVAPAFDFRAILVYGSDGFVLDYPGIAIRVA